jgi:hypothetical protein
MTISTIIPPFLDVRTEGLHFPPVSPLRSQDRRDCEMYSRTLKDTNLLILSHSREYRVTHGHPILRLRI